MKLLTILIPTYNRSTKLLRLLNQIELFINKDDRYLNLIEVIISDNGSNDNTSIILSDFIKNKNNFKFFLQNENKGFDNNIKFLYDIADSEFVWYFSDDDIIFENAFEEIINALQKQNPDILLFSFAQPKTNKILTFSAATSQYSTNEVNKIIELIASYPKLSIYVLKKYKITKENQIYLDTVISKGFYFLSLSFTIISLSKSPKITIITEQLASCDDEFNNFSIPPDIFLFFYETFEHPFVLKTSPNLHIEKKVLSYKNTLEYLFKIKEGHFIVNNMKEYDLYIKSFYFNGDILFRSPALLLQYILLKTNSVKLFSKYGKPIYNKLIKPFRKYYN